MNRSIRRRLTIRLLLGAALLSLILWGLIRVIADRAVEATQDGILAAVTLAVAEEVRGGPGGITADLPQAAFSILGAIGEDRIFYRIEADGQPLTGYDDLTLPDTVPGAVEPSFATVSFRGTPVRVAAIERIVQAGGGPLTARVAVAQSLDTRAATVASLSNLAALIGLGFFLLAALLSVLTARSVTDPVRRLAGAVARRGPQDLRPVDRPVPAELGPLVQALNAFIARLEGSLERTETFIAEAAHHIRTPLSALRTRAEIAARGADPETRAHLREIIRLTDGTARTAGQLLDHAAVTHRSDRVSTSRLDLAQLARETAEGLRAQADLRDISMVLDLPDASVAVQADRVPLQAALRNLIDNALKYAPEESEVIVRLTPGALHDLSVLDRGRGLTDPPETLMIRFARGSNTDDVVGSGLGLAIAATALHAAGGTLTLTPRDGGGTCARLTLPAA